MSAQPHGVSLRLLGDPAIHLPDGSVRALERRAAGLLALVALQPGVTRARAAALLWPQSDDSRKALRQQLLRFRKLFGVMLVGGDEALRLADGVATDLDGGSEPLLGALGFEDCEEFADWLARQRAALRGVQIEPLLKMLVQAESERDFERGLGLAEQLLTIEPDSEAHQRSVIRLHYLRGDLAQAQASYERLKRRLRTRFGTAPSAETEALARLLRSAREPGGALAKATAAAVAVQTPAALLRPPRLIGRARELAALRAAWQAPRAVLVFGEPGLGKSRLLAEFAQGQRVLTVQARPGDAGVPYALLARLLRSVIERCTVALTGGDRTELARLLPELAPGAPPTADGQRLLLQRSIEALLAQAALDGAPLLGLLIDDLHFADDASVEMLQSLIAAPTLAGLRWVLAQRPGEGGTASTALRITLLEAGTLDVIALAPLSEPEVDQLIASLLIAELNAKALASALMRHTGGNPLYVLETIKHGLASGQLRDGRLPQPVSVGALIERRLSQLTPRAIAIARLAAIAGVDFNIALAEQVIGERALALADAWSELHAAQILRDTSFAHDLVCDAVLRQVPDVIARHLHANIAAWLDATGVEPARRARHWQAAGDDNRALDALRAAERRARALGRVEEAGRFSLEAAAACHRLGRDDEAFEYLFTAVNTLSDFLPPEQREPLVARLEQQSRTDGQRAAARLMRNDVLDSQGRHDEALAQVEAALPLARAAGRADIEAELLFAQGKGRYVTGDVAGARAPVARAIELMERFGRPDYAADKLKSLATIDETLGDLRAADAHLTRARHLQVELRAFGNMPLTLAHQATLRIQLGDEAGARMLLDEEPQRLVGELQLHHSAPEVQRLVLKRLLLVRTLLGDYAHGLRLYKEQIKGTAHERDAGVAALSAWLLHHLGRNDLAQPLWQRAQLAGVRAFPRALVTIMQARTDAAFGASLWDGRDDLASGGDLFADALLNGYLAATALDARGLHGLERLIQRATSHHLIGYLGGLHAACADISLRRGDGESALKAATTATHHLRGACIFNPPWAWKQCAEVYRLAGQGADARQCVEEGARWVQRRAGTLPVEYREAFEHRNPVHLALLRQSRRLG